MSSSTLEHKLRAELRLKTEHWESTTHLSTRNNSHVIEHSDIECVSFSFVDIRKTTGTDFVIPASCKYLIIQNKSTTDWISVTITDNSGTDKVIRIPKGKDAILPNPGRMSGVTTIQFNVQSTDRQIAGVGIVS